MRLGDAIDFVQQQIDGPVKTPRPFDSEAVAGTEIHGRIGNQRDNIDAFKRVLKLVHHLAAEDIFWFVDAGRIDEDDLSVVAIQNSLNAITGGLRLGRNDSDLASHQSIDERRLAGVGTADDCYEAGFEWHEIEFYADERRLGRLTPTRTRQRRQGRGERAHATPCA